MKPRIRKRNGLWRCSIFGTRPIGIGYTPVQAYHDWKAWSEAQKQMGIIR